MNCKIYKYEDNLEVFKEIIRRIDAYEKDSSEKYKIVIKPNLVIDSAFEGVTTSPSLLKDLCNFLKLNSKDNFIILEGSMNYLNTRSVFKKSGIELPECIFVDELEEEDFFDVGTFKIPNVLKEKVLIINVSMYKSHRLCGVTGPIKNFIGIMKPSDREDVHKNNTLNEAIFDLSKILEKIPLINLVEIKYLNHISGPLFGRMEQIDKVILGNGLIETENFLANVFETSKIYPLKYGGFTIPKINVPYHKKLNLLEDKNKNYLEFFYAFLYKMKNAETGRKFPDKDIEILTNIIKKIVKEKKEFLAELNQLKDYITKSQIDKELKERFLKSFGVL